MENNQDFKNVNFNTSVYTHFYIIIKLYERDVFAYFPTYVCIYIYMHMYAYIYIHTLFKERHEIYVSVLIMQFNK